jgi:hypothetical protein
MEENLNEGRTQIKRQYGQYSKIKVNEKAPVRNKVIGFVGKRFVTEEEMKNFLSKMNEETGKSFDDKKWFGRNQRYFESFENRGQKVITLSKYGKRVLEMIGKTTQKQTINECVGLFKNIRLNEGKLVNPSDVKDGATSLTDRIKMIESDNKSVGEDVCDMKLLNTLYTTLSKTLRTPENKLMIIDSESNAYDFVLALFIGFQKKREAGDKNVQFVTELSFNSPWHSSNQRRPAYHWHIADANIDLITYEDGDDYSDFQIVVYPINQEKALIEWANKNLSLEDTEY